MKNTLARHTTVLGGECPANAHGDQDVIPVNLSRLVLIYGQFILESL